MYYGCIGRGKTAVPQQNGRIQSSEPSLAVSKYENALPTYLQPGLPDFSLYNIPKRGKIFQIAIKYTKRQQNMYIYQLAVK
jgi:hypothetical protein